MNRVFKVSSWTTGWEDANNNKLSSTTNPMLPRRFADVHLLRVQFKSGYAQTVLNIGGVKPAAVPSVPATGESGTLLIALLCLLPALYMYTRRKRRER